MVELSSARRIAQGWMTNGLLLDAIEIEYIYSFKGSESGRDINSPRWIRISSFLSK